LKLETICENPRIKVNIMRFLAVIALLLTVNSITLSLELDEVSSLTAACDKV